MSQDYLTLEQGTVLADLVEDWEYTTNGSDHTFTGTLFTTDMDDQYTRGAQIVAFYSGSNDPHSWQECSYRICTKFSGGDLVSVDEEGEEVDLGYWRHARKLKQNSGVVKAVENARSLYDKQEEHRAKRVAEARDKTLRTIVSLVEHCWEED